MEQYEKYIKKLLEEKLPKTPFTVFSFPLFSNVN